MQANPQTFFGLPLDNAEKSVIPVESGALYDITWSLASKVGKIHRVLELLWRFLVYGIPDHIARIEVSWDFLVPAKAEVCLVGEPPFSGVGENY